MPSLRGARWLLIAMMSLVTATHNYIPMDTATTTNYNMDDYVAIYPDGEKNIEKQVLYMKGQFNSPLGFNYDMKVTIDVTFLTARHVSVMTMYCETNIDPPADQSKRTEEAVVNKDYTKQSWIINIPSTVHALNLLMSQASSGIPCYTVTGDLKFTRYSFMLNYNQTSNAISGIEPCKFFGTPWKNRNLYKEFKGLLIAVFITFLAIGVHVLVCSIQYCRNKSLL